LFPGDAHQWQSQELLELAINITWKIFFCHKILEDLLLDESLVELLFI